MSGKGTPVFIVQRASAVILIPLAAWFLISALSRLGADYETARAWLANPSYGVLFGAFLIVGAWHMRIGMAEIVIDYVHSWTKDVLLFLNRLLALALIAAAAWSVYAISFAG
jgi:succinate dehydrogenase / fumarate reductase membrane anchor subunit